MNNNIKNKEIGKGKKILKKLKSPALLKNLSKFLMMP